MDAPSVETIDFGSVALKVVIGVLVAILGAILYDMNERLKYVERNAVTPETLKETLREVITETEPRRHR
jgi:hypothetical protein